MPTNEIPSIIHLIALPPYTRENVRYNLDHLAATHPDFDVMVHTSVPDDFVFKGLPVYGPAQLSTLLRYDLLQRHGGWYLDLDVHVHCHLKQLERTLQLGKGLTVAHSGKSVCTFVSCCPLGWGGWDEINNHMLENPKAAAGHYCTGALGRLLKQKPTLCSYIPSNFVMSQTWLDHKGIGHRNALDI